MRRALAAEPVKLPVRKTWGFRRDPLDQGETGTCVAHAAVHFIHASPLRHVEFLNAIALYREIVLLDEYPDNDHEAQILSGAEMQFGSSGTGGAKALEKRGLISEYLWAGRLTDAITWTLTRGPVMVGTNWYPSMFQPDDEGFVRITPGQRPAGGHEWLLRGVDTKREVGFCVNSWGPEWNANARDRQGRPTCRPGHFLIDLTTLGRLFGEDGDAVSAIEKGR